MIRPFNEKHLDMVRNTIKLVNHDAVSYLLKCAPQLWECDSENDSIVIGGYQITQVMDGVAMRYEVFVESVQYCSESGYDYDVIELGKTVRFMDAIILIVNAEMQQWINNNSYSFSLESLV